MNHQSSLSNQISSPSFREHSRTISLPRLATLSGWSSVPQILTQRSTKTLRENYRAYNLLGASYKIKSGNLAFLKQRDRRREAFQKSVRRLNALDHETDYKGNDNYRRELRDSLISETDEIEGQELLKLKSSPITCI